MEGWSPVHNGAADTGRKSWTTRVVTIIVTAEPSVSTLSEASMTPRTTPAAEPLGPESLTWKYFGDLRTGIGKRVGIFQHMG